MTLILSERHGCRLSIRMCALMLLLHRVFYDRYAIVLFCTGDFIKTTGEFCMFIWHFDPPKCFVFSAIFCLTFAVTSHKRLDHWHQSHLKRPGLTDWRQLSFVDKHVALSHDVFFSPPLNLCLLVSCDDFIPFHFQTHPPHQRSTTMITESLPIRAGECCTDEA